MENRDLERRIEELEKENNQLKKDIQYCYEADVMLENAAELQDKLMAMEDHLTQSSEEIESYVFKKESELEKREIHIENEEKRIQALAKKYADIKKNTDKYVNDKAEAAKIAYKSKMLKIVISISALYIVSLIVLYLVLAS